MHKVIETKVNDLINNNIKTYDDGKWDNTITFRSGNKKTNK